MKNTLYILLFLLFALMQSNSTFSLEYNIGENTSMVYFFEKFSSAIGNIDPRNNSPEFCISATRDSNFQNRNFGISSIESDYLDVEPRMYKAITIGNLLAAIVITIVTIVINYIKLILNLF